ncbi:MAG: histidine kinase [Deltaproteobacteria bacterium]|nr:histidine kinase [Deltaproteobacteria bacterium]MBW1818772.1 histidine kinase [Deltaproteobacteria bacterium]
MTKHGIDPIPEQQGSASLPPIDDLESRIHLIDRKRAIKSLAYTAVFNTIIAVFLTNLEFGEGFLSNLIFSQCIGLSICSCVLAGHLFLKAYSPFRHLVMIMITITIGTVAGATLGALLAGISLSAFFQWGPGLFAQTVFIGILFGSVITYFLFSRERITQAGALIQEERIQRLTLEKKEAETQLKLLQAQVEPHFLFNTLSNVLSLVDSDTEKGKAMLSDLIRYLRSSLSRTRMGDGTLGQEMEMIRAFMNIYRVRMGERLRYSIDIPEGLMSRPFPPMLIQPLVENAIKHGLEPKIEGGEVAIKGEAVDDRLRLVVSDTGLGFQGDNESGIGLSNVRQRLQSLYDGRARLILEENRPSGLKAIIEVPDDRDQGDYRG